MQETACGLVGVEGAVDIVCRHDHRQRQVAPCQTLAHADKIRAYARLLAGQKSTRATHAHGDFVSNEMHRVTGAQFACPCEKGRWIEREPRRTLDERLDDHGRGFGGVQLQVGVQGRDGLLHPRVLIDAARHQTKIGGWHGVGNAHQWRIACPKQRHVRHGERADGLAMVATGQADEPMLLRMPEVAPVMGAHLERDLGGGCAIAAVMRVAKAGARREALRQLDHRRMGQARQHDVFDAVHLRVNGRLDARLVMPEQIDPPGTDAVEKTTTLRIEKPHPVATHDFQRRRVGVTLHLRAWVPNGLQAAQRDLARRWVSVGKHRTWRGR